MAAGADTRKNGLRKIQAPPEWGIEPVTQDYRVLGWLDYFVLWSDLGIGLLVMLAGTFLVPGLGLGDALLAILVGSVLGSLLLALIGIIGSDSALPTMVLLRPILGVRGSYLPSALNVLQLIGWTIFEFIIMGVAADAICRNIFGVSNLALWTAAFAAIVILMGIGGPIGVVRQWLEKFAIWIALATGVWLTFIIVTTLNFSTLLSWAGDGSLPFWVAVDIAIALPISWLPLVADYSRFPRKTRRAFWGTFIGFLITNFWFLALGAMLLLGGSVKQEPKQFATAIALDAGWVALLIFLADETHNAWADLYSSAVSLQNIFPKVKQRWLILGLGIFCFFIAVVLDLTKYQNFLFLIGSFFVPLFGVVAADYFILRHRQDHANEPYRTQGFSTIGLVAWIVGIVVYNVTNPTTLGAFVGVWPKLIPNWLTAYGGSIPSFFTALLTYAILGSLFLKRRQHNGKT